MLNKPLLAGALSYVTHLTGYARLVRKRDIKANIDVVQRILPRYCYSVWFRHLMQISKQGYSVPFETVAELGVGSSLGVGLCALLSGSTRYYGLDVYDRTDHRRNSEIFEAVYRLFEANSSIPDEAELSNVFPKPEYLAFPYNLVSQKDLAGVGAKIRSYLNGLDASAEHPIKVCIPWDSDSVIERDSIDLIISQAVFEHVEDLDYTYWSCSKWLKKGGLLSCMIDFQSHGTSIHWNGHWSYGRWTWAIIKGKRPYLVTNRRPLSHHMASAEKAGFEVVHYIPYQRTDGISRSSLAGAFRHMDDEDMTTAGVYMLYRKI